MCQVALSAEISAPAHEVWETVRDFKDPGKYLIVFFNAGEVTSKKKFMKFVLQFFPGQPAMIEIS